MKGILFKPDMNKAILEGRKTVTRLIIKFHSKDGQRIYKFFYSHPGGGFTFIDAETDNNTLKLMQNIDKTGLMPRYQVGETVYVKEPHYRYGHWIKNGISKTGKQKWLFKAISDQVWFTDNPPEYVLRNADKINTGCFKRSALFLSAQLARTFLKIIDVRPERLQEITEEDAVKEGTPINDFFPANTALIAGLTTVDYYAELWDSINPKYPYSSNPWVFRYEFARVMNQIKLEEA